MGFIGLGLSLIFLEETYPPVILVNKASELRRRTKNWGIHAKQEEIEIDLRELLEKNLSRPMRMLISEPIVLALSVYMAFIYGYVKPPLQVVSARADFAFQPTLPHAHVLPDCLPADPWHEPGCR